MINANLRTQLQAKINAATSGTTRSDLMLMRVAAQGLNLDESNLDTLLTPKIDAVLAADPAVDFVEAWRSLGLDGHVQYVAPFATVPGDVLYVDQLGGVKKTKYPTIGFVGANETVLNGFINNGMFTRLGAVKPGLSGTNLMALSLSDGNILLAGLSYNGDTSVSTLCTNVVDPVAQTVLQNATFNPTVGGQSSLSYNRILAAYETAANVFRVWMAVPGAGAEANARQIGYFNLTYNTGTKQVTYSAGASVLVESAGDFGVSPVAQIQSEKFILIKRDSNTDTYSLNLATSALTRYTALTGLSTSISRFDHSSAGNEYARVAYGSTVKLAKGGVDTLIDLPTNLASDGCFGTAGTQYLIGAGMWLCINGTTRVVKVVKFNSTYTTCDIYTVGTMPAVAGAISSHITKTGNVFTAYGTGYAFTFEWTGAAAPTNINMDRRFPTNCFYGADTLAPVDSTAKYVISAFGKTQASATPHQGSRMFLMFDAAEGLPMDTTAFGTVITGAAANQPCEVALTSGTVKSSAKSAGFDVISHGGLLTKLAVAQPSRAGAITQSSVITATNRELLNVAPWIDTYGKCMQAPALSSSAGIYFFKGDCQALATINRYDASNSGLVGALTSRGFTTAAAANSDAGSQASIVAVVKSGALFCAASNTSAFYGDLPR